jgi:hypothetical protein
MHALIDHADGSSTAYFGLSDFQQNSENLTLWFHPEVEADDRKVETTGTVASAISETGFDAQGAFETIGDLAIQDDTEVVVGVTDRHSDVEAAIEELRNDDDFDGDLTVLDADH